MLTCNCCQIYLLSLIEIELVLSTIAERLQITTLVVVACDIWEDWLCELELVPVLWLVQLTHFMIQIVIVLCKVVAQICGFVIEVVLQGSEHSHFLFWILAIFSNAVLWVLRHHRSSYLGLSTVDGFSTLWWTSALLSIESQICQLWRRPFHLLWAMSRTYHISFLLRFISFSLSKYILVGLIENIQQGICTNINFKLLFWLLLLLQVLCLLAFWCPTFRLLRRASVLALRSKSQILEQLGIVISELLPLVLELGYVPLPFKVIILTEILLHHWINIVGIKLIQSPNLLIKSFTFNLLELVALQVVSLRALLNLYGMHDVWFVG